VEYWFIVVNLVRHIKSDGPTRLRPVFINDVDFDLDLPALAQRVRLPVLHCLPDALVEIRVHRHEVDALARATEYPGEQVTALILIKSICATGN